MKKVDGFTRAWWLIQAFTMSLVSVMSTPELNSLLNKEHRGFLDAVSIILIVFIMVLAGISVVMAGVLTAHNVIVSANEEEKKEV